MVAAAHGRSLFSTSHLPLRNTTHPNNFLSPRHSLAGRENSLAKAGGPCRCLFRSYAPDLSPGAARFRPRLGISRRRGGIASLLPPGPVGRVSILGRDAPLEESHFCIYISPPNTKSLHTVWWFSKRSALLVICYKVVNPG